jgi:hypothetical protein
MSANRKVFIAFSARLLVTAWAGGLTACGSGDDNVSAVPPPPDAGSDATVVHADASVDAAVDAGIDAGAYCGPDAQPPTGPCNVCATPASDPYNACSQYTGGCFPFQGKVPTHPTL